MFLCRMCRFQKFKNNRKFDVLLAFNFQDIAFLMFATPKVSVYLQVYFNEIGSNIITNNNEI